jgi:hypothetical protein
MTTLDKLDLSVYNLYAVRTQMREQIDQQLQLDKAATIPPQTQVLNTYVQLTELDILLGIVALHAPWAHFFPPKKFRSIRRSPFTFSRVAPSLKDTDEESEEYAAFMQVECKSPEEEHEKELIKECLKQVSKLNKWLGFIIGRVGQFLQG